MGKIRDSRAMETITGNILGGLWESIAENLEDEFVELLFDFMAENGNTKLSYLSEQFLAETLYKH